MRTGRRCARSTLVVHLAVPSAAGSSVATTTLAPRVGFSVGRAVGGAAVRNRVRRRLRHAAREQLCQLPAQARCVVRALPPAATASYAELADDLRCCLARLLAGGRT